MKKITETSLAGRAICAISNWGILHGHNRVCAAMAWIVCRFSEQPELRSLDVIEEEASADWLDALAVNSMAVIGHNLFA
jgi:hypothetical protein